MIKAIVCTTINSMTEALKKFDEMEDWFLIIVADLKTPNYPELKNGIFLSCEKQESLYPELSDILGWNNVDRRNLGFLYAYQHGAEIVAMIDDDNIPYSSWGKDLLIDGDIHEVDEYRTSSSVFDPLSVTEYSDLWHRGFPIELVRSRKSKKYTRVNKSFLVQADLWNNDPDVDAVCRLRYQPEVNFTGVKHFTSNKISPFNMQNTFVCRKALKYMISIPFTGRMCDIWGAYYLQAHFPGCVVYGPPTVEHTQIRSHESIVKDLEEEILGYRSSMSLLCDLQSNPEDIHKYISSKSSYFIKKYQKYFY
ncbi:MAG: hypothetical protein ACTSU7_01815 [Candidatus Heimdallarchaeaceae archaeon]